MAQLEFTLKKRLGTAGAAPGFALDVTLSIEAGITVLFGASGAGKSLTLDCLAGLLRPDEGRILLSNDILFDSGSGAWVPPQRRGVGYVVQNYALFPHMTLEQNLAFGIYKLPPLERRRRIHEMLELFGLAAKATRRPQELSGGEQQRASIARALVTEPRLLLLDEPARGLDYPLRAEFYDILSGVRERYRIPILLVTHDIREGFFLGDRMAVLSAGTIVQTGSPEDVFRHPQTPHIARLLGVSNVFSGVIEELDPMTNCSRVNAGLFTLTLPYLPGRFKGDRIEFCIAPEQVLLVPATSARAPQPRNNHLPVRIAEEVFTPNAVRLRLVLRSANGAVADNEPASMEKAGSLETEVSRAAYHKLKLAQQRDWLAELPASSIHIFP